MCGIEIKKADAANRDHFVDVSKMVQEVICPNGAKHDSPGQRPGTRFPPYFPSPNGAKPNIPRAARVTPRWGLKSFGVSDPRGEAPGYRVDAPLARKIHRFGDPNRLGGANQSAISRTNGADLVINSRTNGTDLVINSRTNGAKPDSPGHRPGSTAPTHSSSPNGAKPNPDTLE